MQIPAFTAIGGITYQNRHVSVVFSRNFIDSFVKDIKCQYQHLMLQMALNADVDIIILCLNIFIMLNGYTFTL